MLRVDQHAVDAGDQVHRMDLAELADRQREAERAADMQVQDAGGDIADGHFGGCSRAGELSREQQGRTYDPATGALTVRPGSLASAE